MISNKLNTFNSDRKQIKQIAIVKKKLETMKATSNPSTPNIKIHAANTSKPRTNLDVSRVQIMKNQTAFNKSIN